MDNTPKICNFSDSNIWNGGTTPTIEDEVIIQSDIPVTIILGI
jgi:hypothetical protein